MGRLRTLANLSLVNTYLILILYLFLFSLFSGQFSTLKQRFSSFGWIAVTAIPFLVLFSMIAFEFRVKGLLYTGGGKGIWENTVKTLFSRLFSSDDLFLLILVAILFALILIVAIMRLLRDRTLFSPRLVYVIFLAGNLAGAVLLHLVLGVNYPENRVALFLFPLFIGSLCFAVDDLTQVVRKRAALLSLVPLILIPVHFFTHLNLTHASFYIEDLIPASFYKTVKKNHPPGDYPPIVSGKRLRHFCWSFYDFCADGTESQISSTKFPENISDFQIADAEDLFHFREKYITVDSSVVNQRYLLKRRIPATRVMIDENTNVHTPGLVDNEYVLLSSGNFTPLAGKSVYIGITAEIYSPAEPFHTWIVAEIKDSNGQTLQYERVSLYWFRPVWNELTGNFKNGLFFPHIPSGASTMKVYVWNIEKVPFSIENGKVQLFLLE